MENTSRKLNHELLRVKAETLRNFIQQVHDLYHSDACSKEQKELLETVIGAGIWYLPIGFELFSGLISKGATASLSNNLHGVITEDPIFSFNNDWNFTLTEEHRFPRKMAAYKLLTDHFEHVKSGLDSFVDLYIGEIGQFNLVLPIENKKLIQYQKKEKFEDIDAPYKNLGIELLSVQRTFYVDYKSITRRITYRKKLNNVEGIYNIDRAQKDINLKKQINVFLLFLSDLLNNA